MLPFIILAIGLLLVFLEFYLPGGVVGTLGAIVVIGSIIVFAVQYDSIILIVLYTLGTITALVLLFRYALWRIRYGKPGSGIYLDTDQSGYTASHFDQSAIGKVGIVDTDLRPGGHIIVEGERHLAISRSGYIPKGTKVVVTGGEGESLSVKHIKEDKTS